MKRNYACASSFFCFSSVDGLHCIAQLKEASPFVNSLNCIGLLAKVNLKFAVFWSSQKLTSLRGTGASALPPLTIFHSLSEFSDGFTALKFAIGCHIADVAAYLRSIGAPQ
jgi:hypothetical protein